MQVDHVEDAANWSSVITWGHFEQLTDEAAAEGLDRIAERLRTVAQVDRAPLAAARTHAT